MRPSGPGGRLGPRPYARARSSPSDQASQRQDPWSSHWYRRQEHLGERIERQAQRLRGEGHEEEEPEQDQQAVALDLGEAPGIRMGSSPVSTRPPSSGGIGSMLKTASTMLI